MFRVGHGYDVHRLTEGRRLVLGGVEIPYEKGLLGHSDADVLTHAVCDALLGAAALGDIGKHFPDSDDRFLNADSIKLLEKCVGLLRKNGWEIGNIDVTLIAQAPKVSPYTDKMRENIARACGIDVSSVGIKATTEERLGFTGDGLGMSCHSVALIYEK